jgi:hypothetical protein
MSKLTQDKLYIRFFYLRCNIRDTPKEGWTEFTNIKLVNPSAQDVINIIKETFDIKRIAEIEPIVLESWVQVQEELYLADIIKDVYSLVRITTEARQAQEEEANRLLLTKTIDYIESTYKIKVDRGESYLRDNIAQLTLRDLPNDIIFNTLTNKVEEVLYCFPYEGQTGSLTKEELLKDYTEKLADIEKVEEMFNARDNLLQN